MKSLFEGGVLEDKWYENFFDRCEKSSREFHPEKVAELEKSYEQRKAKAIAYMKGIDQKLEPYFKAIADSERIGREDLGILITF